MKNMNKSTRVAVILVCLFLATDLAEYDHWLFGLLMLAFAAVFAEIRLGGKDLLEHMQDFFSEEVKRGPRPSVKVEVGARPRTGVNTIHVPEEDERD